MLRSIQGTVYHSIIKLQPAVARRGCSLRPFSNSARDPSKESKFSDEDQQTKSLRTGASPLPEGSSKPSRVEHKMSMTAEEFLWDEDDDSIGNAMAATNNSAQGHSHVPAQPRSTMETSSKTPGDPNNVARSSAWPSFKVNGPSQTEETTHHHNMDRRRDVSANQAPIQGSDNSPNKTYSRDQSAGRRSEVATKQASIPNNYKEDTLPWETMSLKERKRMHEAFLRSRVLSLYRYLFISLVYGTKQSHVSMEYSILQKQICLMTWHFQSHALSTT
jgi:hypothetical protein